VISCPTSLVIENHQVTGQNGDFRLCNISTAKRRFARFRRRATCSLLQKQNYSSTNYVSHSRFSLIESEGLNPALSSRTNRQHRGEGITT
jgi:hypothetical protein